MIKIKTIVMAVALAGMFSVPANAAESAGVEAEVHGLELRRAVRHL